jgi:hypothetical protein
MLKSVLEDDPKRVTRFAEHLEDIFVRVDGLEHAVERN